MDDILMHLPEHSAYEKDLLIFANDKSVNSDLGHIMSYCCELHDGIDPEDGWLFEPEQKRHWVARCRCSACSEELVTAKQKGVDAVFFYEGEDGQLYEVSGDPAGYGEGGQIIRIPAGEKMTCPYCGAHAVLTHSSKIRGGRTKQIMVETLETVNGHTVIMYWLIRRVFGEYGTEEDTVVPFMAEAITKDGGLRAYTHRKIGMYGQANADILWKPYYGSRWPYEITYQDWGSINNKKKGAFTFKKKLPEMANTSGEKTGIYQYLKAGGRFTDQYIHLWQRFRGVENLLNAGLFSIVEGICKEAYRYSADVLSEAEKYLDVGKVKPHEILGISKTDLKEWLLAGKGPAIEDIKNLRWYYSLGGTLSACRAAVSLREFGDGISALKEMEKTDKSLNLEKIESYLKKQGLRKTDVAYLYDARRFARQLNPGAALTEVQLWPRNLLETHDRLSEAVALITDDENLENFIRRAKLLSKLEWTDGEYRIVIPKSNADLVREGEILHHCVGTYGKSHLIGRDTIFFVRRYKKKNTPYFTLDIDLTGRPKRNQLHGYRNELRGEHNGKMLKIPQSVLDFCVKWEKDILLPWYLEQQKKERKTV